ncbi:dipeptidase [Granulosicoccus sp. 3-233]|uniref:dipeptidase n=1 Tax=Granulosicoccus sp. 3-233 TaxID=3417969 RepID=UPI003D3290A2
MNTEKAEGNARGRVFDGHNDILTRLMQAGGASAAELFLQSGDFHIDRLKARAGNFGGGFFAMWVSSPSSGDYQTMMTQAEYDVPLPELVDRRSALDVVMREAAILIRLQEMGVAEICTTVPALKKCFSSDRLATILHLEGCEAIDPEFHALDVLYEAGLRSLGPVWSRPTIFGEGVPFRFPATPDIGAGLTDLGLELVRRCNEKGILIDLSHLNQKGFDDVARHSRHPLVATHSNAHALCNHARNLTDAQLEQVKASRGMVGLNFASAFLRSDGRMLTDVPVEQMLRHLDYLIEFLGEDSVGLGSDFDGAEIPDFIGDVSGLPRLVAAMQSHGYGEQLIDKLCHGNWFRVLEETWHSNDS